MEQLEFNKEKIRNLRENIKILEEENLPLLKNLLKERAIKIFETYSNINSFTWNQYTPYFNDGDTCTFFVNRDCILVYDNEDNEEELDYGKMPLIGDFLDNINDDELLKLFGDHAQITVDKKDIKVKYYNHS